jgi:hypothetical protein
MASNRLVPSQFAPGIVATGTQIEQNLLELARLFDDVPPDLVQRRWSPSTLCWGYTPPQLAVATTDNANLPWLAARNQVVSAALQPVLAAQVTNEWRAKSNVVQFSNTVRASLLTWEVSMLATHPLIIGAFTCMAEFQATGPYTNGWTYGAVPPTGKINGQATEDFTLQVALSDAWDLENRKKLRQESLIYQLPSSAFRFTREARPAAGYTMLPAWPLAAADQMYQAHAVVAAPLVLVPAGARIHFQFTIPAYAAANNSSWGLAPWRGNIWTFSAQCWNPTRRG